MEYLGLKIKDKFTRDFILPIEICKHNRNMKGFEDKHAQNTVFFFFRINLGMSQ